MLWTRAFDWVFNCYMLIRTFHQKGDMAFFYLGIVSALIFTSFSVFVCIIPCYDQFFKFLKKKAAYNSLPANSDRKTRRASLLALQDAAANIRLNQTRMHEELLDILQNSKRKPNKSNRRNTIPASFSRAKRSSGTEGLLCSSMGNLDTALKRIHLAGELTGETIDGTCDSVQILDSFINS